VAVQLRHLPSAVSLQIIRASRSSSPLLFDVRAADRSRSSQPWRATRRFHTRSLHYRSANPRPVRCCSSINPPAYWAESRGTANARPVSGAGLFQGMLARRRGHEADSCRARRSVTSSTILKVICLSGTNRPIRRLWGCKSGTYLCSPEGMVS